VIIPSRRVKTIDAWPRIGASSESGMPTEGARTDRTTWSPAATSSIAPTSGSSSERLRAFASTDSRSGQIMSERTPRWLTSGASREARASMSPRRIASSQSLQMISMFEVGRVVAIGCSFRQDLPAKE